jgi:PAS domain-containing protein
MGTPVLSRRLAKDGPVQNQLNLIKGINRHDLLHVATAKGEGSFALDHGGHLLFMNDEAERLLGWSKQELEGKHFFNRVDFKIGVNFSPSLLTYSFFA